jgi:hypothetical protein
MCKRFATKINFGLLKAVEKRYAYAYKQLEQ